MPETRILFVDDEESFRIITAKELVRVGYLVDTAGSLEEARTALGAQTYHLVLLDVRLPDGNGLELLEDIRSSLPGTQVVMLTAYGTVQEAIQAMRKGAHDFLSKPCKLGELEAVLARAIEVSHLERGNMALQRDVDRLRPSDRFVGETAGVKELHDLVGRVATTDSTVLIRGESGVGKELVARAVHRQSHRAKQPFVVVDCASLHENLLQSELFGHEKGAYTGAVRLKHGLFEVADRGTIFLDEIAEMTPPLQVKLLRVLETGIFRRVGGTHDVKVDVRMIAATNRPLEIMLKDGTLREDLYYRLNVFPIALPRLSERREDISVLAEHFRKQIEDQERSGVQAWDPAALRHLEAYPWPGNVRELRNVVHRAHVMTEGDTILPEVLEELLPDVPRPAAATSSRGTPTTRTSPSSTAKRTRKR